MFAELTGGPYDGIVLDDDAINRTCQFVPARTEDRVRNFLLLPPLAEWEKLRTGELTKSGHFGSFNVYEQVAKEGGGVEFRYDDGQTFAAIMRDSKSHG